MSFLRIAATRIARPAFGRVVRPMTTVAEEVAAVVTIPEELTAPLTEAEKASGDWVQVRVPVMEATLEWVLSSPPPLHAFEEPPIIHECTDDSECEWHNPLAH